MCRCTRRSAMGMAVAFVALCPRAHAAPAPEHELFVAGAFRLKDAAVRAGDQAYGALIVWNGQIAGYGPSRVRERGETAGHAEQVAIRDAQQRLARDDLTGCVMYSTSRPCGVCQRAAREAKLSRMYYGESAIDAGKP
jgi:tRNA(Arg) A34 adenosine deaminase TadA